ncbi:MAG: hypothetical protein A2539_01685 [Elusimicrobia bacterium RIFOXYD2_FULL_34_15]|nr:MAG: hypothetical protein A2539_01685 [Elusimicrobia bacterium RIFOXYD2_FULL_34_15]
MIVSAFTLGISHPSGYPLYVLLGKIFTLVIPFGNIAYRINLMSAVFGAMACSLLFYVLNYLLSEGEKQIQQINKSKRLLILVCSTLCVFIFAFTSSMWSLSIVSEMYSMNAFFAILMISLLFLTNNLLFIVFVFGLGLCNHQTLILFLPGILYFILKKKIHLNFSLIKKLMLFFVLGFSVYIFLPVRSAQNPVANWDEPAKSLRNFVRIVTRADYGSIRLHPEQSPTTDISAIVNNLFNFLKVSVQQFDFWVIPFLIFGIYWTVKKKNFMLFFLFWLFSGPIFFIVSNLPLEDKTSLPILEPYLIMPLIIFVVWIGIGIYNFLLKLGEHAGLKNTIALAFLILVLVISFNIKNLDKRYEFIAYDYSKDLLKTLPFNSILYNPDDTTTFTLKYQQECLNKRKDIKLAVFYKTFWGYEQLKEKHPEILPKYEIKSGMELENTLISYNFNRFPFYSDNIGKIPRNYNVSPKGLLYGNSAVDETIFDLYVEPRISGKKRFFTHQIINYYSAGYNNLGLVFSGKKIYNRSIKLFEKAISIDPELSQAYNNLGVVYWEQGNFNRAAEYFQNALNYAPNDEGIKQNLQMSQEKLELQRSKSMKSLNKPGSGIK